MIRAEEQRGGRPEPVPRLSGAMREGCYGSELAAVCGSGEGPQASS